MKIYESSTAEFAINDNKIYCFRTWDNVLDKGISPILEAEVTFPLRIEPFGKNTGPYGRFEFDSLASSSLTFTASRDVNYSIKKYNKSLWVGVLAQQQAITARGGIQHFNTEGNQDITQQVFCPTHGSIMLTMLPTSCVNRKKEHVCFIHNYNSVQDFVLIPKLFLELSNRGFTTFVLFEGLYTNGPDPDLGREYKFSNEGLIERFIFHAKRHGFNILLYMQPLRFSVHIRENDINAFISKYISDGVYLDNAAFPGVKWLDLLSIIKGINGTIFHHNTIDPVGSSTGLVFSALDAYCKWTLKGEGVTYKQDNYDYLDLYVKGLSRNLWMAKYSSGLAHTLTENEVQRFVYRQNLGCLRIGHPNSTTLADFDRWV